MAQTDIIVLGTGIDFRVSERNKYKDTHERIMAHARKKGINFINTSVYEFNPKEAIFRQGQYFDGKEWKMRENIKPDRVWYKSNKIGHLTNHVHEEFDFMNDLKLILLANNKYDTAKVFKDFSPETQRMTRLMWKNNRIEWLRDEPYIIKPNNGSGGSGIMKVHRDSLRDTLEKFWYGAENFIVQEYLDMRCGVPGVVEGMHDLRFSVFGKEIFPFVYVRKPMEWDFRSNVSVGGTDYFVPLEKIPEEAIKMVTEIMNYIDSHIGHSLFTVDMVNTTKGFKLMELNSSPWFLFKERDIQDLYFDYILKTLKS